MDEFPTFSSWAKKALRSCVTNVTGRIRPMTAPGESTLAQIVPAYFKRTPTDYIAFSKDLVSRIEKIEDQQKSLVLAKKQSIRDFPLITYNPVFKSNPEILTKGDVIRESNVELISWVYEALEKATGFEIKIHSERTQEEKSRPDMVWFYVVPGKPTGDGQEKVFAVLEFKNTKFIDIDGFKPAIFRQQLGMTEAAFQDATLVTRDQTLIDGNNALWLTKQMTKYARNSESPHQIAFDYTTMLTLDFEPDLVKHTKAQPKSVQIDWLDEESRDGTNLKTHRAYLLGYLYYALQETCKRQGIPMN